MISLRASFIFSCVVAGLIHSTQLAAERAATSTKEQSRLDDRSREDFIRRAQVWSPTDIPALDLRKGPGDFAPNQTVTCEYVPEKLHGSNRKFGCAIAPGHVVKVRYGERNREVQGSVIATRLLWALGFEADRVYPVQVRCIGCSSDPWHHPERSNDEHLFAPAVIERRPPGTEMTDDHGKSGWTWRELDVVDESAGGAPLAQRDALKLLAVFMQHTDTKPQQQRLLCLPGGLDDEGRCATPFMMLHDVGLTFGRASRMNGQSGASVDFEHWAGTPVWKPGEACVGHLSKSITGTLENPRISEAGRAFLANLLTQLSDRQLYDLFELAGVPGVSQWVDAFKQKREEIALARCPR